MEQKLIKFVKHNKFLYDKRESSYRNVDLKEEKWKEIAQYLNLPVKRVKQRWATLRDSYQRQKKKHEQSDGDEVSPGKYWKYFNLMQFLDGTPTSNFRAPKYLFNEKNEEITTTVEEIDISPFIEEIENEKTDESNSSTILDESIIDDDKNESGEINLVNLMENVCHDTNELLALAKQFLQPPNSTSLFFSSIAAQIQEAELPTESIAHIKFAVLKIVQDEITKHGYKDDIS